MKNIQISFSPEIIGSYKRLSYKVWYALAEFVDNSTQAYYNNESQLKQAFNSEGKQLEVHIQYYKGQSFEDDYFEITDNSIGMSIDELEYAFNIGSPPQNNMGRSRYGLGMKTAAFWLGDEWSLTTKKLGDAKEFVVDLNVDSISEGNLKLNIQEKSTNKDLHYTTIRIKKLHRRFKTRSISKIKSYLSSIYRFDIQDNILALFWNDDPINWVNYTDEDFIKNRDGEICKRNFEFSISDKKVSGWAGILRTGGRHKGGFAIVQSNRVIQSPPDGYKPESMFGEQEGGVNDLANQRIVGELFLDGFEVSHTKDSILWEGTEEDDLDDSIRTEVGDFRKTALEHRSKPIDERRPSDVELNMAVDEFLEELKSPEVIDTLNTIEVPPEKIIIKSNRQIQASVIKNSEPTQIRINELLVKLYLDDDMSVHDPYVITDTMTSKEEIIVIVNKNHPYWNELEGVIGIKNYLRQCVYDGVAEWKAFFKVGNIFPDTVKYIKDDLLRVPFIIEKAKIL